MLIGVSPPENPDSPKAGPESSAANGRSSENAGEHDRTSNCKKCRPLPKGAGMVVKLCDFGLARYLPRSGASALDATRVKQLAADAAAGATAPKAPEPLNNGLSSYVVTRWYRAPEVSSAAMCLDVPDMCTVCRYSSWGLASRW